MKDCIIYNTVQATFIKNDYNYNTSGLWNRITEVEIGSVWEDTLGTSVWKNGREIQRGIYREITVTDKTSNSIQYFSDGHYSWIEVEDFFRINNLSKKELADESGKKFENYNVNGKQRMVKVEK